MKNIRVLVVDDSEIVLEMAREALERHGVQVDTAESAKEANAFIFSQKRPDLIILDVMLPVLDGDKKAKMLKENPATRDIPILLLSSKPESELRFLAKESGSDGYIRKPFDQEQLARIVQETLGKKVVNG